MVTKTIYPLSESNILGPLLSPSSSLYVAMFLVNLFLIVVEGVVCFYLFNHNYIQNTWVRSHLLVVWLFWGRIFFEVSGIVFVLTSFGLFSSPVFSALTDFVFYSAILIAFFPRKSYLIPNLFGAWVSLFQEYSTIIFLRLLDFLNLFTVAQILIIFR